MLMLGRYMFRHPILVKFTEAEGHAEGDDYWIRLLGCLFYSLGNFVQNSSYLNYFIDRHCVSVGVCSSDNCASFLD